jgi:hypothetical protein
VLKKTITFPDLDGNEVTDDFYFHLSKAELVEMEVSHGGGMRQYLTSIIESGNGGMIIAAFKEILAKAYGKRSADGRSFLKSDQYTMEFLGSEAYSKLFMELVTDAQASAEFVNGIMPADLVAEAEKRSQQTLLDPSGKLNTPTQEETDNRPAWERENRDPTRQELLKMSTEEMAAAMRRRVQNTAGD